MKILVDLWNKLLRKSEIKRTIGFKEACEKFKKMCPDEYISVVFEYTSCNGDTNHECSLYSETTKHFYGSTFNECLDMAEKNIKKYNAEKSTRKIESEI